MSRRKIGGDDLGGGCRVSITEFVTCEKCGMEEFIEIAKGQRWNLNEDICDTCIKNYVDKKEDEYNKELGCSHYSGKCGSPTSCNDEDCPKKEKKIRFCESQCCSMGFATYSKESWKCDYLGYYGDELDYRCEKYNEVLTPFSFDGKKETMIVFRCIDCHTYNPSSVQERVAVDKTDIKMLQLPPEKIKEAKEILKKMVKRDTARSKTLYTHDITIADLIGGKKRSKFWKDFLNHLKDRWVGDYPDRIHNVRCGTAYIKNRGGTFNNKKWAAGEIVIELRFDILPDLGKEKKIFLKNYIRKSGEDKMCSHKAVIRGSVDDGPGSAHNGWICQECGLEFVALEGNVKKLLDKESMKIIKKITKAMKNHENNLE
ncbi:MAG: hypothetical protein PHW73_04110 [Atribacterota bacterium]|nr:hypothetical protein [Atribacterota bacterium]